MSEYVGVDIGSECLALAVVARGKAGPAVKSFSCFPYPQAPMDLAARAAFAAKTLAESAFAKLPVAVSVSGAEVFLRPLTVPFTKASMVAKTLKFEMDGRLPFDLESAVMDFAVVGTADKSSKLLVAAMGRETLEAVAGPFESAGLDLKTVTADVLAAPMLARFLEGPGTALLGVSASAWKLSVCSGNSLVFARAAAATPAGYSKIEDALSGWVKQSMMAAPPEAGIDKLYLVGELSGTLDCKALEDSIGVPVSPAALPDSAFDSSALEARGEVSRVGMWAAAVAMGLSLGRSDFDIYAVARGRQGPIDKIFAPAMIALCVMTALFAVVGWEYSRQLTASRASVAAAESEELRLWKQLFGEERPQGGVYAALRAKLRDIEDNSGEKALGGKAAPLLRALYVVSRAVESSNAVEFLRFRAENGKVIVSATASNDAAAEKLAGDISAEGAFEAKVQGLKSEGGRLSFEIVMTPKGQR